MPGFIGRRLCPHLVFIKPNYPKYRQISDEFKAVLRQYDQKMESCGLDEANLDLTDFLVDNNLDNQLGRIFVATQIREKIFQRIRMTASCGIACNRMLAKICSELNKPNG
jgi:DNA polymerase kappa